MKLIKYFFSIPFNPKNEWEKANLEIDTSSKLTEDIMAIFLVLAFLSIGYSYYYDMNYGDGYFSIESVIGHYFKLIITSVGAVVGIRLLGTQYGINNMTFSKVFVIYLLASGFINILSSFAFLLLFYLGFYGLFWYYLLTLAFYVLTAIYIVLAFLPNKELNFRDRELSKNLPAIFFFTAVLFAVNLIYSYAIEFLFNFAYLLN